MRDLGPYLQELLEDAAQLRVPAQLTLDNVQRFSSRYEKFADMLLERTETDAASVEFAVLALGLVALALKSAMQSPAYNTWLAELRRAGRIR